LDVLRFIAFLMVFLSHVVPGDEAFFTQAHVPLQIANLIIAVAAGGAWGVDLFFALSSYLITTLLLRERKERGTIDVSSFYVRRILRIWPLYFAFLFCIAPIVHFFVPADDMAAKYILAYALLAGNWACVLWGYPHSVASPLWSVSIEEQFYLSWPLVLRRCTDHLVVAACTLLVVAFLSRSWLVVRGEIHPQIWCNTFARLDPIASGALVAVYGQRHSFALAPRSRLTLLSIGFVILAAIGRFGDFVGSKAVITFPAANLACISLLVATLGVPMPVMRSAFVSVVTYLGRISYGLYVFHATFIGIFGVTAAHDPVSRSARIVAALVVTIAVAACSHRFLEKPFLRLKDRYTRVKSGRA